MSCSFSAFQNQVEKCEYKTDWKMSFCLFELAIEVRAVTFLAWSKLKICQRTEVYRVKRDEKKKEKNLFFFFGPFEL